MEHPEYELQHSTTPQPKLLDGECATRDWPMPGATPWPKLLQRAEQQRVAEAEHERQQKRIQNGFLSKVFERIWQ